MIIRVQFTEDFHRDHPFEDMLTSTWRDDMLTVRKLADDFLISKYQLHGVDYDDPDFRSFADDAERMLITFRTRGKELAHKHFGDYSYIKSITTKWADVVVVIVGQDDVQSSDEAIQDKRTGQHDPA